jgi:phosphoribosylanthranilate isomerase
LSFTRIKICGITNAEDARISLKLGADYLGMVFVDSPRRIEIERAQEIRRAEPRAMLVGVFKDSPLAEVVSITREAGLDFVQLHGRETPDYCDDVLAKTGRPVIKAFTSSDFPDVRGLSRYRTAGYFLFDLDKRIMDDPPSEEFIQRMWDIVARKRRKGFRIFLSGALDQNNVREAVRRTNAFGVDVCRGVEKSPGIKDPKTLEAFIREVRR